MQLPSMTSLSSALLAMHNMHQNRMADAAEADAVTAAHKQKAARKAALRRLEDDEEEATFEMLMLFLRR